jgi:hypothetical protein
MLNLEDSTNDSFEVLPAVRKRQVNVTAHFAEAMQWPYVAEACETTNEILNTPTSETRVDV